MGDRPSATAAYWTAAGFVALAITSFAGLGIRLLLPTAGGGSTALGDSLLTVHGVAGGAALLPLFAPVLAALAAADRASLPRPWPLRLDVVAGALLLAALAAMV